jgi:hypothetical protein
MAKRTQLTASEPSGAAAAVATATTEDVQQHIRERAYQLFEARGREPGHELEDWLRAEAEILALWPRLAA